jgi:hypothetical protein
MKLPSLNYLAQNAGHTFLRFPLSIIAGLLGAATAIYLVEENDQIKNFFPFINLLLTFALGISLFFSADVFSYAKNFSKQKRYLLHGLVLLILVAVYFSFPGFESTQNTSVPYVRYGIYSITVHLLVAFIPFLKAGQLNGFWHYNKILFVRILAAVLYSGVLYGGLALALGSLDFLFDIDIHEELFADLFIFIAGVFNTWFFLAGIPSDFRRLDDIDEYPKGIKIFSQYVLLTLLILYIVILYIYAGKIVFLWSWPKGLVSYLVACVAVLGILTLLLIHPYGNLPGNTWIKKFSKAYYFILVPLIALLFIAIGMRVSDYGVTINRYVIVLLGVWLTIVAVYFIIGKQNIKFIPISLAVILMFVSFGYWGIFSVSERSQVQRLQTILEQANILKEGKIQHEVMWLRDSLPQTLLPVDKEETNELVLSDSLHNEVKSILDYLDDHHGFTAIRGWFVQDLDSIVKENNKEKERWNRLDEARAYMKTMGLAYTHKYGTAITQYFAYYASSADVMDVRHFDYVVDLDGYYYGDEEDSTFRIVDQEYSFVGPESDDRNAYLISGTDSLKFEVAKLARALAIKYGEMHQHDIAESEMSITAESQKLVVKLEMSRLNLHGSPDSLRIENMTGIILIKVKQ